MARLARGARRQEDVPQRLRLVGFPKLHEEIAFQRKALIERQQRCRLDAIQDRAGRPARPVTGRTSRSINGRLIAEPVAKALPTYACRLQRLSHHRTRKANPGRNKIPVNDAINVSFFPIFSDAHRRPA